MTANRNAVSAKVVSKKIGKVRVGRQKSAARISGEVRNE